MSMQFMHGSFNVSLLLELDMIIRHVFCIQL